MLPAGKNRPLDEDELDFVEKVLDQERQKDRSVRAEEQAALDIFQQASHGPRYCDAAPCRPRQHIQWQAVLVCIYLINPSILPLIHIGIQVYRLGAC